ncbi:diguanylate cyclase domain-containing protein [Glaciecola petra]|uniref:diguanylate cyclase n=1 Tax=Glaciecola petra TaxID=3075602 RepID=A0ABU2ZVE2_9ALTE|nr:diguanylate cyclase [Aestuariibacter sp. P117]MDT0595387.1 diguanylate cyclase [Aestuariibacter sp. P117]
MLLKHKINIFIAITAFFSAFVAFSAAIWVLDNYLAARDKEQRQAAIVTIKQDIEVFDRILAVVEEKWADELQISLRNLAKDLFAAAPNKIDISNELLRQLRTKHQLSDVHLINTDLVVFDSTYLPEIGIDMKGYSDNYTANLERLMNNGEFFTHRVSLSTETGDLKKYAYYSHPGSNIIVNGDLDIKSRFDKGKNDEIADYLFGDYIQKLAGKYKTINEVDVFIVSQVDQWSLFKQGTKIDEKIARNLYNGIDVEIPHNAYIAPILMQSYDEVGLKAFLLIEFNNSLLENTKSNLLWIMLLVALWVMVFVYACLRSGGKALIVDRFASLLEQIKANGDVQNVAIKISGNDELNQLALSINDMMKRIKKEQAKNKKLVDISLQDSLTTLANRRWFDQKITLEWSSAKLTNSDFSVLMIDVDFFKKYNDLYGHSSGDRCLRKIATILKTVMSRPTDFIARYGGEEFICILPNTDPAGARKIADEILKAVSDAKIIHENSTVHSTVTVSIGCFSTTGDAKLGVGNIIEEVDKLLYLSKNRGRNCVSQNTH